MSKLDGSTHTLNTSTSKQTYSFSKANRFLPSLKPMYLHFDLVMIFFMISPLKEVEEQQALE